MFDVIMWGIAILSGLGVLAAAAMCVKIALGDRRQDRAPAPQLNPRWDTSVCKHESVVEVFAGNESEPISYICTNPECYAQVDLNDDRAKRAEVDSKWSAASAYVEVMPAIQGFKTELLQDKSEAVVQAERFAARVREEERRIVTEWRRKA